MTELMFGRYFVLEGKVENLFSWIEHNTESEWSVEAKGICPISDQLILVSFFAVEQDLIYFETECLNSQNNQSSIYANRRNSRFSWPASKERRGSKDRLRVEVIDTGCGIPLDQQKELFKAFSRLGQENGEIEGTGIGLVVTRQLVELMNGSIGFESQEDQGSTFWVELPIAGSQNSDEDDLDAENSSDTSISQLAE